MPIGRHRAPAHLKRQAARKLRMSGRAVFGAVGARAIPLHPTRTMQGALL
jgi:hypothetical protein